MIDDDLNKWKLGVLMRKRGNYIGTHSYTIYDQYTSQMYHNFIKSRVGSFSEGTEGIHLFDVKYKDLNQIVYVHADDPIIAAIGLMENGYTILEHITKL